MSGSGLARSIQGPHQQREITCGRLKEELLMNVLPASDIESVQAAGIELMCEVPFDAFSPLPLKALASFSLNAPPVGVDRFLFRRLAFPVTSTPLGFGHVSPHSQLSQAHRDSVAVVSLVRHYFFDALMVHFILTFRSLFRDQA